MKQYGFFQAIYKSFYSRDLYRDVESNWGLEVAWYLAMVLALCWIMAVVQFQGEFTRSYEQLATNLVHQLPVIQINKGQISTPENRPYLIKDARGQETLMVIDASGKYKTLEDAHTSFLITKDIIMTHNNDNEVRLYKLPDSLTTQIVPAQVKGLLDKLIKWSWVLIFPFCWFFSFMYRVIQAFVYALLGKCISFIVKVPLKYSSIVKLCMVALTPTLVITALLDWLQITFHFQGLFYFIVAMGYLAYAICAQRKNSK